MNIDIFNILITIAYFLQLFKPKEDKDDSTKIIYQPPKSLLLACQQIVDCLIESLLQLEETSADGIKLINIYIASIMLWSVNKYYFCIYRDWFITAHSSLPLHIAFVCEN